MGEISGGIEYTQYGDGWQQRTVGGPKPGEWEDCDPADLPESVLVEEAKKRVRRVVIEGKITQEALEEAVKSVPGTEASRMAALAEGVASGLQAGKLGIKIVRANGKVE